MTFFSRLRSPAGKDKEQKEECAECPYSVRQTATHFNNVFAGRIMLMHAVISLIRLNEVTVVRQDRRKWKLAASVG